MATEKIEALLALRAAGRSPVGRDRIALLEAVATHGSITAAAQAVGLSYKAAWDALNAINNLLPRPALVAQAGGRQGGGATVTEEGHRLIDTFRRLESKLAEISATLSTHGLDDRSELFWSVAMKTSARNAFRCQVVAVQAAPVNVEVTLKVSETNTITAIITNDSAVDLGIVPGRDAVALVKSSFVMLARGDSWPRVSARNRIWGTIIEREDGRVNSELTLDIGEAKTLTAVISRESAEQLPLAVGDRACALFKASHVILAVD